MGLFIYLFDLKFWDCIFSFVAINRIIWIYFETPATLQTNIKHLPIKMTRTCSVTGSRSRFPVNSK